MFQLPQLGMPRYNCWINHFLLDDMMHWNTLSSFISQFMYTFMWSNIIDINISIYLSSPLKMLSSTFGKLYGNSNLVYALVYRRSFNAGT